MAGKSCAVCRDPLGDKAMMKRVTAARAVAGMFFLAIGPGPALACKNPSSSLTTALLTSTLTGSRIACYKPGSTFQNQEFLSGTTSGSVSDYKLGTGTGAGTDPTAVVGSYTIALDSNSKGMITYTYPSVAFAYYVVPEVGTTAGNTGTYDFYVGADGTGSNCVTFIAVAVEGGNGPCA
jgi:hypothetical protein